MSPEQIVNILVEDGVEDDFDPKEAALTVELKNGGWTHVDGDIHLWEYGGTAYNYKTQQLLHIDGLEDLRNGNDRVEKQSWDIKLTAEQKAQVLAQFPVDLEYPEDPDSYDANESDRERAEDELKQKLADEHNAAIKQKVYVTTVDENDFDENESFPDWKAIKDSIGIDTPLKDIAPEFRLAMAAQHHGWHEFDYYPNSYTLAEFKDRFKFNPERLRD